MARTSSLAFLPDPPQRAATRSRLRSIPLVSISLTRITKSASATKFLVKSFAHSFAVVIMAGARESKIFPQNLIYIKESVGLSHAFFFIFSCRFYPVIKTPFTKNGYIIIRFSLVCTITVPCFYTSYCVYKNFNILLTIQTFFIIICIWERGSRFITVTCGKRRIV